MISVIIPTYNSENFIFDCIDSILKQTFQDFEIIIVDNFSTDKTLSIVKNFYDNRVKIHSVNNQGIIAKSRNLGILKSNFEYVAFLDSDDYWYPTKLEKCVKALDDNIAVCHFMTKNKLFKIKKSSEYISFIDLFKHGNKIFTSSLVIKKECLIECNSFCENKSLVTVEDYDLWIRVTYKYEKIFQIRETLGYYRIHENNTSSYKRYKKAMTYLLDRHVNKVPKEIYKSRVKLLKKELALLTLKNILGKIFA